MGLGQLNFDLRNKEDEAIHLLQEYASHAPFQFCMSFGKDSIVAHDLVKRSGVPFVAVHNRTGIDPPELIKFGRVNYPEVVIEKPKYSIWEGIEKHHGLPVRQRRWCCELLKEYSGSGKWLVTGIRAAESARRSHRHQVEDIASSPKSSVSKYVKANKSFIHPIFNWSEVDVWEYIRAHNLPYCELYDIAGWNRIGCIMCPMQSWEKSLRDWQRYPKIAQAFYRAEERYHARMLPQWIAKDTKWADSTPESLWWWWLTRGSVSVETVKWRAEKMGLIKLAPFERLWLRDSPKRLSEVNHD